MHLAPASATAASLHHRPRESNESSSNSEYEDESDDEHPQAVASDQPHTLADNNDSDHHHYHLPSWLQNRRVAVAREIKKDRERRVIHLHEAKAKHYVDHCFSFVLGNLAVVCLVLGCVYRDRSCDKPLAAFLIILGCLAPFAACTPILARQWFYLHLRCNLVASAVFFMTFLYLVWFLVGQQWAFESSHRNCDEELSTAANAVVFLMFLATLAYVAKVLWYLLLRVRYSYSALWSSCWRDPYPDAMTVTEDELLELEAIVISTNESATTTIATSTHLRRQEC